MSPHFILGRENVPCVAEVVNRSLKADCTDYTLQSFSVLLSYTKADNVNGLICVLDVGSHRKFHRLTGLLEDEITL